MEALSIEILILLIVAGFIAAFVDAVVGGGGLITVPALMLTGLPPSMVLGTNKLGGTLCSLTSMVAFWRSGNIHVPLAAALFPLSFIGSIAGTYAVHLLPPHYLKPVVVILLIVVTLYTLFKRNWGEQNRYQAPTVSKAILLGVMALVLGCYDGFFGPGTGSFLIFMFLWSGFHYVGASANAKVLNLGSNLGSLMTFAFMGSVNLAYGIPLGIAMIVGALVGTKVAVKKGSTYVKPLFIGVTTLLIGKQIYDFLSKN
ncbi:sulfite exporter TauE/SafE family protein [Paenibacillus sp. 481]|uniref:sulfite exporter TauE/SafE family protein n=1 Tax=Paenibacillus sp. 481 TaxID=2835869 RepID=UPI001E3DB517|nr:TSUP family transporter [Paenibacillus sp. 481]UHA73832.1 TSUP family transporter [Paenibacillus sp. 481]